MPRMFIGQRPLGDWVRERCLDFKRLFDDDIGHKTAARQSVYKPLWSALECYGLALTNISHSPWKDYWPGLLKQTWTWNVKETVNEYIRTRMIKLGFKMWIWKTEHVLLIFLVRLICVQLLQVSMGWNIKSYEDEGEGVNLDFFLDLRVDNGANEAEKNSRWCDFFS